MPILRNARQERFAQAIAKGATQTDAAIKAGYKNPKGNAHRIMENEDVKARIAELAEKIAERTVVSVERLVKEAARLAYSNVTDIVSFKGKTLTLKDSAELTDDITAAISEVSKTKDGIKIKLHSKQAALELLARHKGMFRGNLNLNVTLSLSDLVLASYQPPELPAPEMKTVEGKET